MTACYETHPQLDVGGGCVISGGNSTDPVVKDADLYVGFQQPMFTASAHDIAFPIEDFWAPKDAEGFRTVVVRVSNFLQPGRRVHAGCTAGHGRTGLFLSALVA